MKKLLIIALLISPIASSSADEYNSEQFKKDLDVLVPLASKLKGKCLAEKDASACEESDAIVRSLREIATKNSSGKTLSKEDQDKLIQLSVNALQTGNLDTFEAANPSK